MKGWSSIKVPNEIKKKIFQLRIEFERMGEDLPEHAIITKLLDFFEKHKACYITDHVKHLIDYLTELRLKEHEIITSLRSRVSELEAKIAELESKDVELNDFELLRNWFVKVMDKFAVSDFSSKDKELVNASLYNLIKYLYGDINQPKLDLKKLYRFAKKIENIKNED